MIRRWMVALLPVGLLWPQALTQGERDYAMSQLHATRKMLLDAIADLTPAQWRFKPGGGRSIAECIEHVILAEDFVSERVQRLLAEPPQRDRRSTLDDDAVYRQAADATREPAFADAMLSPRGRFALPEEAARAFRERRDRTIAYVATTQDPLRLRLDGAGEQALDAYQWFVRLAGFTERIVEEIQRIKADPKYPRGRGA